MGNRIAFWITLAALAASALPSGFADFEVDGPVAGEVVAVFYDAVPDDIDSYVAPVGTVVARGEALPWVAVDSADMAAAKTYLKARSDVRVAYDAKVARPASSTSAPVNDPYYGLQWALPAVGLPEAWSVTRGSHDVTVAVVDFGYGRINSDLSENVCPGGVEFGRFGEQNHDHGNHVAGIVAAESDNGIGIAGASQSCLMLITIQSANCNVEPCLFSTDYYVAEAIAYATLAGAEIVSMSLSTSPTPLTDDAIGLAIDRGVLLVAAAGNYGSEGPHAACSGTGSAVAYPARDPRVVAVANLAPLPNATEPQQRANDSRCGPELELAAPGTDIYSTVTGGEYAYMSGTSMATPLVAGVAALVFDVRGSLVPEGALVRCILGATADTWDGLDPRHVGAGRVNAAAAVAAALDPASVGC